MAHAWANADFAAALQGADPYGAIRAVLGVVVPPDTPLPEIPPRCGHGMPTPCRAQTPAQAFGNAFASWMALTLALERS